jgi:hypothetical protein
MATLRTHAMRFPGETPKYRAARNQLLTAERNLRRRVEQVAAMRRKLPPGGGFPRTTSSKRGQGISLTQITRTPSSFLSCFETAWIL